MPSPTAEDLNKDLASLHITPTPKPRKAAPLPLVDSWEEADASSSSSSSSDIEASSPTHSRKASHRPTAPPPTPISPTIIPSTGASSIAERFSGYAPPVTTERERRPAGEKRQDKTDAVAKRMIAGALGAKAPKRTEEEKAYDRAAREREVKRREREKEGEETARREKERAKAAVWED